jgi:hypothetical protein
VYECEPPLCAHAHSRERADMRVLRYLLVVCRTRGGQREFGPLSGCPRGACAVWRAARLRETPGFYCSVRGWFGARIEGLRCSVFWCELSSLLTVKTLTGMSTDVYPREKCVP